MNTVRFVEQFNPVEQLSRENESFVPQVRPVRPVGYYLQESIPTFKKNDYLGMDL